VFLIRERLYVQEWSIGTVTRLHRQTLEQRFPHDFRIEVQGHWANVEAVFCAYYENPVIHSTWLLLLRQIVVFDERDGRVLSADLIDPSDAAALMVGPTPCLEYKPSVLRLAEIQWSMLALHCPRR
jgi:hypothetical protein